MIVYLFIFILKCKIYGYFFFIKNDNPTNSYNLIINRVNKGKAFDDEIAGFINER